MIGFHPISRGSSPSQYVVIAWVAILALAGVGLFCLYLGFTAAPEKVAAAAKLRKTGIVFLLFACGVFLLHRAIEWIIDHA